LFPKKEQTNYSRWNMTKSQKSFCPKCLEHNACRRITITNRITLHGVDMHVEAKRLQCGACGYVFPQKMLEQENYNVIFEMYQDITGEALHLDRTELEFGNLS
jgi:ribosomal protein S27AE